MLVSIPACADTPSCPDEPFNSLFTHEARTHLEYSEKGLETWTVAAPGQLKDYYLGGLQVDQSNSKEELIFRAFLETNADSARVTSSFVIQAKERNQFTIHLRYFRRPQPEDACSYAFELALRE